MAVNENTRSSISTRGSTFFSRRVAERYRGQAAQCGRGSPCLETFRTHPGALLWNLLWVTLPGPRDGPDNLRRARTIRFCKHPALSGPPGAAPPRERVPGGPRQLRPAPSPLPQSRGLSPEPRAPRAPVVPGQRHPAPFRFPSPFPFRFPFRLPFPFPSHPRSHSGSRSHSHPIPVPMPVPVPAVPALPAARPELTCRLPPLRRF